MTSTKTKYKYALILGSSSGFGAATAIRLSREGYKIFGVHLDRKQTMYRVEEIINEIKKNGSNPEFFNINAAASDKRKEVIEQIRQSIPDEGYLSVFLHSLAFGTLKPFIADLPEEAISQGNMDMTLDVMAHSLVYWVQDLYWAKLLGFGSRIFAMTSYGSTHVVPYYGAVSAAKAALESHIRQLAMELAPIGATANAIRGGVTNTPALQKIPGHEKMVHAAVERNPGRRLTTPEDVANAIAAFTGEDCQWMNGNVIGVDNAESVVDYIK
ncbi:MAG: SDR family oxidoreductase [Calditrichaeota bacterium]|nr:SDR family oxidoreductase [Calditrichota bacterium]RQV99087.1 MAG: SDR family oxidoreductase [Calditrichota bacterium]